MAEQNKDIVELKNDSGIIIYPKTTGEAVYLLTGESLQAFLDNLHNALKYNIIPEADQGVSIGSSAKQVKAIYVAKVIVGDTIEASTVKANQIHGNVNSSGTDNTVWGAVFN